MASASVIGSLLYLRSRSLQNMLVSRFRRLKQPKYLMGAVIGIAYLYFVFLRRFSAHPGPLPGGHLGQLPTDLPLFSILGSIGLLIFVALCWVLPRERAALSFTEAEIAFLFPAPISRRALIHYRLISLAMTTTFTALILALVTSRTPGISPVAAIRIVGWWLVFSTVGLHIVGSAFALTRLQDRGISTLGCQLLAIGITALLVGLPVAWLWHITPAGETLGAATFQIGPIGWLLLPFKLMVAPLVATDGHSFLHAVWPALLVYAAHYLWVLLVQVDFEEASIARAEKRATKLAAMRAGNWRLGAGKQKARRAPFNLARAWRPELAFLWKNLLSTAPYLRLRNALIIAALIVFGCTWFADSELYRSLRLPLATVVMVFAGYLVVLGPQLARQDFRSDMPNTDILKTYPLRGWQIMLGEILTPAAILTGLIWLMLLAGAMLFPAAGLPRLAWLTPQIRTVGTIGVALVVPLLCISQLLVVNTAAVLFPAWLQASANRTQQGIEVMGQRIFFMFGQLFVMVVMLLPAAFIAALVFFPVHWIVGDAAATGVAALLVAAIMGGEICLGLLWLGRRFERLDLSVELRS